VRLGTCFALELAVAAGAIAGVAVCVTRASELADEYLTTREAAAATLAPAPARVAEPLALPRASLPVAREKPNTVFGRFDSELLAPIGGKVVKVKFNRGGTSLSLRVDFENGSKCAFKPEQTFPQSDPRREIAAYRIDRLLEIGHVPPAKPIAIPLADLIAALDPATRAQGIARLTEEAIARGGVLYGEASWWIPEIKYAKLGKNLIDEREGRLEWLGYLQIGATIPDEVRPLIEQISSVLLFDLLIDNADRWSGNNTMSSLDGKILYFMDNTMSFSLARHGHEVPVALMKRVQVFSRSLVAKMRALTREVLFAALAPDEDSKLLGRLLAPDEIRTIINRRDNMMEHIDALIAEHGEDAVLAFP
jgi:hypothetical protein